MKKKINEYGMFPELREHNLPMTIIFLEVCAIMICATIAIIMGGN